MPRIQLLILICTTSMLAFSCENYDDLKPHLRNHTEILEKTIGSIRKADSSTRVSSALRTFNESMKEMLTEYRDAKMKHPGLKDLFINPPASLRDEVVRIGELNTALRHSLLLTVDHGSDAGLRLQLAETISLLDAFSRE